MTSIARIDVRPGLLRRLPLLLAGLLALGSASACAGPATSGQATGSGSIGSPTPGPPQLELLSPTFAQLPTRALVTVPGAEAGVAVAVRDEDVAQPLSKATTDSSGRAWLSWIWPQVGEHRLRAQVAEAPASEAASSTAETTAANPDPAVTPETRGDDNAAIFDAGGQRMWLDCRGQGGPTMVLISGVWGWSKDWNSMVNQLRAGGRVCTYDRPGLGASPGRTGTLDVDAGVHAQELASLLDAAGEEGPFLLVAHSYGGLVARAYNNLFPARTAGLCLLDPVPADFAKTYPGYNATLDEGTPETSLDLARSSDVSGRTNPLAGLPLIVLAAGSPPDWLPEEGWSLWQQAQRQTAASSENSLSRVANGASHQLQDTATELATAAALELRTANREHRPVAAQGVLAGAVNAGNG